MASKFISKIFTISLVTAICLSIIPFRVLADSSVMKEQVFKFYLDPALVPDMNFAQAVLPKYVADMNVILSKNTNRRLVFDPQSGIILTSTKPHTDSAVPPLPTEGFEIWVHAVRTSSTLSFGGYAGMDKSGAGVLAGFNWTRLYDPDNLTTADQVTDYTIQLDHMLHELAHVFGAGLGEYYSLAAITDTTGMEPLLNIKLSDPADRYWSDKPDFMTDPLLRYTHASSRAEHLAVVQYSNLTAAVISGSYRNGLPPLDHYVIQVLDQNGLPVIGANVKIWNVKGIYLNSSELLFDVSSDENGQVIVPWGGGSSTHNAANFLRLIKVYKDGRPIAKPRYFSIFDADSAMLVSGESPITLTLEPGPLESKSFSSIGKNDGWVLESGQGNQKGGAFNAKAGTFLLGDDMSNRQYRSILSFNTKPLPDNAIITDVTLTILKQSVTGEDPFITHGNLQVDIRHGSFHTRPSLQGADFQALSSQSNAGIFSAQSSNGWYTAELNAQAYPFINMAGGTQFRLEFDLGNDGDKTTDAIKFFDGSAVDPAKRPQLIIEYYLP